MDKRRYDNRDLSYDIVISKTKGRNRQLSNIKVTLS